MLKYTIILFLLLLITKSNANNKEKIIENLFNTRNLDFKFEQNINGKIENGNCTIESVSYTHLTLPTIYSV